MRLIENSFTLNNIHAVWLQLNPTYRVCMNVTDSVVRFRQSWKQRTKLLTWNSNIISYVSSDNSRIFKYYFSISLYKYLCIYNLGWAPWNLSCLEFKFDDTRLSYWHKNKIGRIDFFLLLPDFANSLPCWLSQQNWASQQGRKLAKSGSNKKNQFCQSYS